MKIAYIAHPIGGDVKNNLGRIRGIVRDINIGYPDVVPFVPYYADCVSMDDSIPEERARGIKNDKEFFYRGVIDEVWVYGEVISKGMKAEIELAHEMKIPVVIKDPRLQ